MITSTPHPRRAKNLPAKGHKTVETLVIKVQVHDGNGMRTVSVSSDESLPDLLEKIANILKRPHLLVQMGYEAPWSAKVSGKKVPAYLTSEAELEELWVSYRTSPAGKKHKVGELSGIVIRNMIDNAVVRHRDKRASRD